MPTQQEVDKVKENLIDLITFLSSLKFQGASIIQNYAAPVPNNFQTGINLYSNALTTLQNVNSNYLAATIAGYTMLVPANLTVNYLTILDAYNAIYDQSIISLDSFIDNAEACWYNMCTGTIYTPNGFYNLSVTLNEIANASFYKETDAIYNTKLNEALVALEDSLKYSCRS